MLSGYRDIYGIGKSFGVVKRNEVVPPAIHCDLASFVLVAFYAIYEKLLHARKLAGSGSGSGSGGQDLLKREFAALFWWCYRAASRLRQV
ncbi:hypothetical protein AcV7_005021 [Taiwanofungus camphoratus]|nr:hypothetical protein AcV7_005021 [Antrodia cinnamomea]